MSGEGETAAPKDEFDALPLFVQRVTRKDAKTAENEVSSSSKEGKERVKICKLIR